MQAYSHHGQKQFQEISRVPAKGQHATGLKRWPSDKANHSCDNSLLIVVHNQVLIVSLKQSFMQFLIKIFSLNFISNLVATYIST